MKNAYERFFRPLLFSFDPETAHHIAIAMLRRASNFDLARQTLRAFQPPPKPTTIFDLKFPNPIGLAAGFDKNGVALPAWEALGFGFIEIGTVTARPQAGNPRPRIFRYPGQQALINRLGFNNDGADLVAKRLRKLRESGRWPRIPIGINIGKSKVTPLEEAAADYRYSFLQLHPFGDYIALNISSPNTPGLRTLQSHESLSSLLDTIQQANKDAQKPIVVKIAPDLQPDELEQIISCCETNRVAGLIATNTTIDHSSIPPGRDQEGGLSGTPLRERSTEFVRTITKRSGIPVIASGGIFDAASAREKLAAGAKLLQVYTGLIYRGPDLLREIAEML